MLRYNYDGDRRLAEVIDAVGNRCSYAYDERANEREINMGGMRFSFRYDTQGRCVETTGQDDFGRIALKFDDSARMTQVTDSLYHVTTYLWNQAASVEKVISPSGE